MKAAFFIVKKIFIKSFFVKKQNIVFVIDSDYYSQYFSIVFKVRLWYNSSWSDKKITISENGNKKLFLMR